MSCETVEEGWKCTFTCFRGISMARGYGTDENLEKAVQESKDNCETNLSGGTPN